MAKLQACRGGRGQQRVTKEEEREKKGSQGQ